MENATNGLIMAGSVLVGVIIISLFVYMFSSMGGIAKEFQENIDLGAVQKFNEPFEKYIGREDLTAHDLLTVYNLVNQVNNEADMKIIELKGITTQDIKNISAFLSNQKTYKLLSENVRYSTGTQKINYIEFKEVR